MTTTTGVIREVRPVKSPTEYTTTSSQDGPHIAWHRGKAWLVIPGLYNIHGPDGWFPLTLDDATVLKRGAYYAKKELGAALDPREVEAEEA
jgi:hypothetical protein